MGSIKNGLVRCDIVEEVFSKFTSKYDEARVMQINHLVSIPMRSDKNLTKQLCDKVDEKVDVYAAADLEHAAEAVSLLWEVSNNDECQPPEPKGSSKSRPVATSPANWEFVNTALIRSIREGVFVDRMYFTRHSGTLKVLRPVHFSSIVAGGRLGSIDRLVKQYGGKDAYFAEGDKFEDNDYDDEPDQCGDSGTEP